MRRLIVALVAAAACCGDNRAAPVASPDGAPADAPIVPRARVVAIASNLQPRLAAGTSLALTVTATYDDGTVADVSAQATFLTGDPLIATVTGNVLHAKIRGDTPLHVSYDARAFTTLVTVTDAYLASISVTAPSIRVPLGGAPQLIAIGQYSDATKLDLSAAVAWSSSADPIATVSSLGLVATHGTGIATITATAAGVAGRTDLDVEIATALRLYPAAPDVAIGTDFALSAIATFAGGPEAEVSAVVAWSSSDVAAPVGPTGIVSVLAPTAATISAQIPGGALASTTIASHLDDVGLWDPEPGFAGHTPCVAGIVLAPPDAYACTTDAGPSHGTIAGTAIAWAAATGADNPNGLAIASATYTATPAGAAANWFHSIDHGASYTASARLVDSLGAPRYLYATTTLANLGNLVATWDPAAGAQVVTGLDVPATVHALGAGTGIARAIASTAPTNLYVAVLGQTPTGVPARGGLFRSTDLATTWTEIDVGFEDLDRPQIAALAIDPVEARVVYAGLRGGGRLYKSTDFGAVWKPSATGLPLYAQVNQIAIDPIVPSTVFAATTLGLFQSINAGKTWTLAGFPGRDVRAIARGAVTLAGVADANGVYRAQ